MMPEALHVIFGTGPVGCWIARSLRERDIAVRAVNRSGARPDLLPPDVEVVAADLGVTEQARKAATGAAVLYHATNPAYHEWHRYFPGLQANAMAAAMEAGARYVSIENLYMYDSSSPMREDSRISPRSAKGVLRARMAAELLDAQARGDLAVAILRSSDYYGPGVLGSALGERVFAPLLRGRKAQLGGAADVPHSFAYIEDVGAAAALLGLRDEAPGQIWFTPHAPPCTQRDMVETACAIHGVPCRFTVVSPAMMSLAGLFIPGARASVEMLYEFTEPFIVDSTKMEQAFGIRATPVGTGLQRTMQWYAARQS